MTNKQYILMAAVLAVVALCLRRDCLAHSFFRGSAGQGSAISQVFSSGEQCDIENRQKSKGGISPEYDGDGNRVRKTTSEGRTHFLVDDRNPTGYAQVLEELEGQPSDPPSAKYVFGTDLIKQVRSGGEHYFGYDGQGSVRYLTESTSGAVTDRYTYDAFGVLLSGQGTSENSYRYAGEQWDEHLGMYYLRARYYNPDLDRFWTRDAYEGSQTDPLSLHKYLYCHADPVNNIDPSGHESVRTRLGKEVHRKLGEIFTGHGKIPLRFSSRAVATIGGPLGLPIPEGIQVLLPDLVDAARKEVYEIKPLTAYGLATGYFQALGYVSLLNQIDPSGGWRLGNTWSPPSFITLPPSSGFAGGAAFISPPVGGIIFYEAMTIQQIARRGNRTVRASQRNQLQQQMGIATMLSVLGKL